MTWADEQTIREIYLKPFELGVKKAGIDISYIKDDKGTWDTKAITGATGVMSAFNYIGNRWAGGDSSLLEKLLRDEWGFRGTVVTDACFYSYMDYPQMIRNGGDIPLRTIITPNLGDKSNPVLQHAMRRAAHNICYTKVNSNAVNGIKPNSTIHYGLAPWQLIYIILDIIGGIIILLLLIKIIRGRKNA
jgi:beta-glucosidase